MIHIAILKDELTLETEKGVYRPILGQTKKNAGYSCQIIKTYILPFTPKIQLYLKSQQMYFKLMVKCGPIKKVSEYSLDVFVNYYGKLLSLFPKEQFFISNKRGY